MAAIIDLLYVKVVQAKNGDYAILARTDDDTPWVQVEATKGLVGAEVYAEALEDEEDLRVAQVDYCEEGGIDWGDSAPADPVEA